MSESQSRYSIVERLTESKLQVMDNANELDLDMRQGEQEIEKRKADLMQWKSDIQEDIKRKERQMLREIEDLQKQLAVKREYRESKKKLYDAKIAEIDKALGAIEIISKASAEEAKA